MREMFTASIKEHKSRLRKLINENEKCYASLANKDSEYAQVVRALQDLHRQAYDIYNNARFTKNHP